MVPRTYKHPPAPPPRRRRAARRFAGEGAGHCRALARHPRRPPPRRCSAPTPAPRCASVGARTTHHLAAPTGAAAQALPRSSPTPLRVPSRLLAWDRRPGSARGRHRQIRPGSSLPGHRCHLGRRAAPLLRPSTLLACSPDRRRLGSARARRHRIRTPRRRIQLSELPPSPWTRVRRGRLFPVHGRNRAVRPRRRRPEAGVGFRSSPPAAARGGKGREGWWRRGGRSPPESPKRGDVGAYCELARR